MSKTAFLDFLRSPEGGGLRIRTQTYYRIIGELQTAVATLPAEWNRPLDQVPTAEEILPITRPYASRQFWYHTHVFEWIPGPEGYIMVPHRYTVKTTQSLTRAEALGIAQEAMQWHQPLYGVEGSFISGGVYIGTWQPVAPPD